MTENRREYFMRLTNNEMVFFMYVTKGQPLWGIELSFPGLINEGQFMADMKASLIQDGIIDEKHNFTVKGLGIAKLIDSYRNSDQCVQINQIYIGTQKGSRSVVMMKLEDGSYDVEYYYNMDIIGLVFRLYPMFENKKYIDINEEYKKLKHEELMVKLENYYENQFVMIKKYQEAEELTYVFFWNERHVYEYDVRKEQYREIWILSAIEDIGTVLDEEEITCQVQLLRESI